MLYLTRHAGESIRIGKNIVITVDRIKGRIVRLGIDAPADVKILRTELPVAEDAGTREIPVVPVPKIDLTIAPSPP